MVFRLEGKTEGGTDSSVPPNITVVSSYPPGDIASPRSSSYLAWRGPPGRGRLAGVPEWHVSRFQARAKCRCPAEWTAEWPGAGPRSGLEAVHSGQSCRMQPLTVSWGEEGKVRIRIGIRRFRY